MRFIRRVDSSESSTLLLILNVSWACGVGGSSLAISSDSEARDGIVVVVVNLNAMLYRLAIGDDAEQLLGGVESWWEQDGNLLLLTGTALSGYLVQVIGGNNRNASLAEKKNVLLNVWFISLPGDFGQVEKKHVTFRNDPGLRNH